MLSSRLRTAVQEHCPSQSLTEVVNGFLNNKTVHTHAPKPKAERTNPSGQKLCTVDYSIQDVFHRLYPSCKVQGSSAPLKLTMYLTDMTPYLLFVARW